MHRIPAIQIMSGDHHRGPNIIESGRVSNLEERDLVEIIVDNGSLPSSVPAISQFEVSYMLGTERFTKSVKKGTTVEEFKESLKFIHRRSQIAAVANHEGYIIAEEDDLEEWLSRSTGKPFRVLPTKQVQCH
jgi:hypothetical protein